MARITSSAALSETNTRGLRSNSSDDPFEDDNQGPSDVQLSDAMKGGHSGDQLEEDHGGDVANMAPSAGKAARPGRKKQKRNDGHGVRTTQAPAQEGGDNDSDADGAGTSHKGKGKDTVVRLNPMGEDENRDTDEDGGIGNGHQIAKDTSTEEPVVKKRKRGRPSKAATKALDNGSRPLKKALPTSSQNKRKRGDMSQSEPRRSSRAAAKSANAQITEQSVKRPRANAPTTTAPTSQHKARSSVGKGSRGRRQEYEVEKIVNSRLDKRTGSVEYFVKWAGYPSSGNTWEPADNLTHCRQKLTQYQSAQKTK